MASASSVDAVAAVAFAASAVVAAVAAVVAESTRRVQLAYAALSLAAVGLFAYVTQFNG